jgi:hypothetical protein
MAYSGINSLVLPEQNTSGKIDSSIPRPPLYTTGGEQGEKRQPPKVSQDARGKTISYLIWNKRTLLPSSPSSSPLHLLYKIIIIT